jgi:hypothetical protein
MWECGCLLEFRFNFGVNGPMLKVGLVDYFVDFESP